MALLELRHLCQYFRLDGGHVLKAVDDVSLTIADGETLGLIGESGCGKSTLARTIMGLHEATSGELLFAGQNISTAALRQPWQKKLAKDLHMIFQDSDGALNPRMTGADSIREGLRLTHGHQGGEDALLTRLLHRVGLDDRYGAMYPADLSGGQRQRIAIARCLAVAPRLMIADEPIAALDVSIQAQIINLLKDLQAEQHFSMLFIAHDLAVVRHISQRVAVMYAGKLVEIGPTEAIFNHPGNAYTRQLLASILRPDPIYERQKIVPAYSRDDYDLDGELVETGPGHFVRTQSKT